jgi:hypothetical protein
MGVYIKGMDMPKQGCFRCFLRAGNYCSRLPETVIEYAVKDERHPNCPLVEVQTPHGRLLDEDVILPKRDKKKGIVYIGNFAEIEAVIEAEE